MSTSKPVKSQERQKDLADALRENLRKRKAQQRERKDPKQNS